MKAETLGMMIFASLTWLQEPLSFGWWANLIFWAICFCLSFLPNNHTKQ